MKNSTFRLRDEAEKATKLRAMLRQKTGDRLTDEQLRDMSLQIHTGRQYTVVVHEDAAGFCQRNVLVRSGPEHDRGSVVFGQILFGTATDTGYRESQLFDAGHAACTIITREHYPDGCSHTIHIYIPPHIKRKGTHYAKQKAANRA